MTEQHGPETRPREAGELILSVSPVGRGREPVRLPVRINSLSATGALLESQEAQASPLLLALAGRDARILIPPDSPAPLREITGRLAWVRPVRRKNGGMMMAFELQEPDLEVRRVLEDHMASFPRDLKELWDAWDEVHRSRPAQMAEQAAYLVGVGAVAAGTTLYLAGPETLKLYGSVMALYGCLMMAAKSIWSLWRARAASRP